MRNLKIKSYFVYILASKSGILYTGITGNLERRVYEHKNKLIPGFTSKYNVNRLVYFEEHFDVLMAIENEKRVKKWNRSKKINLIRKFNPELRDLAENFNSEISRFTRDDS